MSYALFTLVIHAQVPKEGDTSGITSFTGTFMAVAMGHKRVQLIYEVYGVNISDTVQDLLHNASFRCVGSMHAIKNVYEDDTGFCINIRLDGDQVFLTYKASGKMGVGGKARYTYVGGTGKLTGIQGGGEFERISSVRAAAEGTFQGYIRGKGHYKLP
ncbi:MAG: hypothetical protein ABSH06_03710 [Thermodesulfobacteriota bacterium]